MGSKASIPDPRAVIRQRRRAALRSSAGPARRITPTARPSRAANSSRRVVTKGGAAAVASPPAAAPDFSTSSKAHNASPSRRARTQISRSNPAPQSQVPPANGRPRWLTQSSVVTSATGRVSLGAEVSRPKANAKAAATSAGTSAPTSSNASAARGKTEGFWIADRCSKLAGIIA